MWGVAVSGLVSLEADGKGKGEEEVDSIPQWWYTISCEKTSAIRSKGGVRKV